MKLYIGYPLGGGRTRTLEVEPDDSVYTIMEKLHDQNGATPESTNLIVSGSARKIEIGFYYTPRLREGYGNKGSISYGKGDNTLYFLLLNQPNFHISFHFTCPKEIHELAKEFILFLNFILDKEHYEKITGVGRKIVFLCGTEVVADCVMRSVQEENIKLKIQKRDFEYYFVRSDVWSIVIMDYVYPVTETLEDYGIVEEYSKVYAVNRRRMIIENDVYYERDHTKKFIKPSFVSQTKPKQKRGINIIGVCNFEHCESFGREIIVPYSHNVIFFNREKQFPDFGKEFRGTSFDNHFDLLDEKTYFHCPSCSILMKLRRFCFVNCWWKWSSFSSPFRMSLSERVFRKKWQYAGPAGTSTTPNEYVPDEEYLLQGGRVQVQVSFLKVAEGHFPRTCCLCLNKIGRIEDFRTSLENPLPKNDEVGDLIHLECGHGVHKSCRLMWSKNAECIECEMMSSKYSLKYPEDERESIEFLLMYCCCEEYEGGLLKLGEMYIPKLFFLL